MLPGATPLPVVCIPRSSAASISIDIEALHAAALTHENLPLSILIKTTIECHMLVIEVLLSLLLQDTFSGLFSSLRIVALSSVIVSCRET